MRVPTVRSHPLVRELSQVIARVEAVGQSTSQELLEQFWSEVERRGTPLLHDADGSTRATFLYREGIEHMIDRELAFHRVTAAWASSYTASYLGPAVALSLLPRSNVWWAEVDVPADFTGVYYFEMDNHEGLITEDIHEPWAMSFDDAYNPRHTRDADSAYPRCVLTMKEQRVAAREGTSTVVDVAAGLLPLPNRCDPAGPGRPRQEKPRAETYPVWTYSPPTHAGDHQRSPLVVLMAGQFLEAKDLARGLDLAIDAGAMPPIRVCGPGRYGSGHNAWGWRNGYGPGDLSEFFTDAMLPAVEEGLGPVDAVHLLAWAYTTNVAVQTALGMPGRVSSLILIDPVANLAGSRRGISVWNVEESLASLAEANPGLLVSVGTSPDRGDGPFSWSYPHAERFIAAARAAGLDVRTFEVTDPNMCAQAEAVPAGIASVLR